MKAQDVLNEFKKKFGPKIKNPVIQKVLVSDREKHVTERIWFHIDRKDLHNAVAYLCEKYPYPHFSVCSGYEIGKELDLMYHFTVNYAVRAGEIMITIHVMLPKKDPVIGTITGLIPGAVISEREMQEMLGIRVKGIPDSRRLFLDESFPKGVFPWRRDETGPHKLIRNAHRR